MYQHLCITITLKNDILYPVSLAACHNGSTKMVEHGHVRKTTEADDVTQELTLLTSIVNERVRALESAVVGFNVLFKKDILVATYLLRAH